MTVTQMALQNSLNAVIKYEHGHYVVLIHPTFSDGLTITISRVQKAPVTEDCLLHNYLSIYWHGILVSG